MENKKYEVYRGNYITIKQKNKEIFKSVVDKRKWRYPEWR